MNISLKKILLFSILNILFIFVSIIEENMAIFFAGEALFILGVIIIKYIFHKKYNSNSIEIFLLFYIIYFFVMYLGHNLILLHGSSFFSPDEKYFFDASNNIIPYLKEGYSLLDVQKIFIYSENSAQIYFSGQLGIIANYFGNNSIIIQKLFVVFFAALIPTTIYNIFVIFMKDKTALKASFYYGLLSFILFFSFRLLRDIPVAELFILVIYLALQKISLKNIFLLVFFIFLSIMMRYETGLYVIGYLFVMLLIYLYAKKLSMTSKLVIASVPIVFIIFMASSYLDIFNYITEFSQYNLERISGTASSGSIGIKLRTLPYGLNYFTTTVFSQMSPFPPWLHMAFDEFFILFFFEFIATISWFYVWSFILFSLIQYKQWSVLDFRIKFLFLYSILFIILIASIEPETRRMMAVYPIIYLVATISFINLNSNKKKKIFIYSTLIYLMLLISYEIIKI